MTNSISRWARYIRLLFDFIQYWAYLLLDPAQNGRSGPIPPSSDFTVISVTLGIQHDHATNVRSWLTCDLAAVVIITNDEAFPELQALMDSIADPRVHVYSVPGSSWRLGACEGIRHSKTPYLVFVDDDVVWGSQTLEHMAYAFSNREVGGVNTMQEVHPNGLHFTTWETFGALNLVRRNILHSFQAYFRDGELLNLSGRTAGYRTKIIQREEFYFALMNEFWRGRYVINTGDDNFITSWVVRRGWKTRFLNQKEAMISTSVNDDASYLKQLMRWSRDTARNYLRDFGFAITSRRMSYLVYCIFKIMANYASDFAVIAEIGILLFITASWSSCTEADMVSYQRL